MNHHTPERHLVVLETTFQDQCEVKIKIKNRKRGKVRRHECLLHFSWIYTHPHTSTYSPLFQPVWCDRINQLASWGGKCGETPLTAGLLCRIVDVQCTVYIASLQYLVHWQLRSWPHLNPAIRRRTLGDTLSFSSHSSMLVHFQKLSKTSQNYPKLFKTSQNFSKLFNFQLKTYLINQTLVPCSFLNLANLFHLLSDQPLPFEPLMKVWSAAVHCKQ